MKKYFSAIDIGTQTIKFLLASKEGKDSKLKIIAQEEVPSLGVKKGKVDKVKKTAENLVALKKKVEEKHKIKLKSSIFSLNGNHLYGLKSQGIVSVSRADQKISREDMERALEASQAVNLKSKIQKVWEIISQEYVIDGQGEIKDPVGLEGVRLEVKALLICLSTPILDNLEEAVAEADITAEKIIPSVMAVGKSVLDSQQMEVGAVAVDLGAGATIVSVYYNDNLVDFQVIPSGSGSITNDIAICLRTDISTAEDIKKQYASLSGGGKRKRKKDRIEIPEKEISAPLPYIQQIVEARYNEIFLEIKKLLKRSGKEQSFPGGVVLTGGGSVVPGIVDFAKKKFELPSYRAGVKNVEGVSDPRFSLCAGTLLRSMEKEEMLGEKGDRKLVEIIKKIAKMFSP